MNHLAALRQLASPYRTPGRDLTPQERAGLGQVNLIPPDIVAGVKELITLQSDSAKKEILAEVDKKGEEAKTRALLGGLAAGAAGVVIGAVLVRVMK